MHGTGSLDDVKQKTHFSQQNYLLELMWQASFPTESVGPQVGIFLYLLNSIDGFYFSRD